MREEPDNNSAGVDVSDDADALLRVFEDTISARLLFRCSLLKPLEGSPFVALLLQVHPVETELGLQFASQ